MPGIAASRSVRSRSDWKLCEYGANGFSVSAQSRVGVSTLIDSAWRRYHSHPWSVRKTFVLSATTSSRRRPPGYVGVA